MSLALGTLVLLFAFGSYAWPVILVELASVAGSALFLFGGDESRRTAVVLLGVAATFEVIGGAIALILAFFLISVQSSLGGFSLLIGLYALIFSVPVIAIGAIDLYTVYRVRDAVFGPAGAKRPEPRLTATLPAVNLQPP